MTLLGRLHPLIVHFPIALVLGAAAAETSAAATGRRHWRTVAIVGVRVGAAWAVAAVIVGWLFAADESTPLLEWHRWLGVFAATAATAAAVATSRVGRWSYGHLWTYRVALFWAAA